MKRFAEHAYASYVQGSPTLMHLPLLVRFNVSSALEQNAEILGVIPEYFDWEGVSPFYKQGRTPSLQRQLYEWPATLHPTQIQHTVKHHPWLDVFPDPTFRDNLIQAFGQHPDICDEDELCHDTCELSNLDKESMLFVWGPPWDIGSWEVSNEFLRKWGWLLSGCTGMVTATNHWRAKRGEKPITPTDLCGAMLSSRPRKLR